MKKRNPNHHMQVSVVLPKALVRKIVALGKQNGRNRTKQIEAMLQESVTNQETK